MEVKDGYDDLASHGPSGIHQHSLAAPSRERILSAAGHGESALSSSSTSVAADLGAHSIISDDVRLLVQTLGTAADLL